MILNLICIGALLAILSYWSTKGFFSSFLHLICVVLAGAVAFGLWEVVAGLLLSFSSPSGFMNIFESGARGMGLLIPFAVSLALFRFISDKVVGSGMKFPTAVDFAGGAICGAGTAMIAIGITVIGLGYFRLSPNFLQFAPVAYADEGGSLVRKGGLWIKADTLTATLYKTVSTASLRSGQPLATWHPNVDIAGYANRYSEGEGKARNAIPEDSFSIQSRYTVGSPSSPLAPQDALQFTIDGAALPQKVFTIDGDLPEPGYIEGLVIDLSREAGESTGQIMLGTGQVRLLVESTSDRGVTRDVFPFAVVSAAQGGDQLGRWRFDGENVFISSVGGAVDVTMAFEFFVPQGFTPKAIYIKNTRQRLDTEVNGQLTLPEPEAEYANWERRDNAVASNTIFEGGGIDLDSLDTSGATQVTAQATSRTSVLNVNPDIGFNFQRRQAGSLEVDDERLIIRGSQTFADETLNTATGPDGARLAIQRLYAPPGTQVVQLDVGPESDASLLGRVALTAGRVVPPQLVDTEGRVYQCVGWIYRSGTGSSALTRLRYTPGEYLRGLSDLPEGLSQTRTDQRLKLLFVVSENVNLYGYTLGDQVVVEFTPPVNIPASRR